MIVMIIMITPAYYYAPAYYEDGVGTAMIDWTGLLDIGARWR
jgi:hypothetical protein